MEKIQVKKDRQQLPAPGVPLSGVIIDCHVGLKITDKCSKY